MIHVMLSVAFRISHKDTALNTFSGPGFSREQHTANHESCLTRCFFTEGPYVYLYRPSAQLHSQGHTVHALPAQ